MSNNKIQSIQYIRGLSALAVVFCHYGMSLTFYPNVSKVLSGGQLGIYTFFLISGFVIIHSLNQKKYQPKHFFNFLFKRSLRIDPPYILMLILFLLTFYSLHFIPSFAGKNMPFIPTQFIAHILYIIPFTKYEFYDHVFWTLSIEFQFYLLIGIFYFISYNQYYRLGFLFLFSISCFVPHINGYYSIFNYAPAFATGMALTSVYQAKSLLNLLSLLCCIIISYFHFGLTISILLLTATLIILYSTITSKKLHFLGEISYSLYITHTLLSIFLFGITKRLLVVTPINEITILLVKVLIAIGVAYVYYILIEKPSIKLSKSISLGNNV